MSKKNKSLVVASEDGKSLAEIITLATKKGDLERLEKLLALKERYDQNEAKKAYHVAMAKFKENPPKIVKDRKVSYKDVRYNYASLANVIENVSKELSKHGLSVAWITRQGDELINVTCKITHILGHSEETTLSAKADTTGSKNAIQAVGSTVAYLERYTLLALIGLATYEDDDGRLGGNGREYITKEEGNKILDGLISFGGDTKTQDATMKNFLTYMGVSDIKEIERKDFRKAMNAIENANKKNKGVKK